MLLKQLHKSKINIYVSVSNQIKRFNSQTTILNFSEKFIQSNIKDNIAIIDDYNTTDEVKLSYKDLNNISTKLAFELSNNIKQTNNDYSSIGVFTKSNVSFVISILATLKLGKVFVPLSITHSEDEINYILGDSNSALICYSSKHLSNTNYLTGNPNITMIKTDDIIDNYLKYNDNKESYLNKEERKFSLDCNQIKNDTGAMVIYTSGTTGRPKGVLHTHESVSAMIFGLVQAWKYSEYDKILHFLPLYHVHGLINKLLCVLSVGGTVEFLPSAAPKVIWSRLTHEELLYKQSINNATETKELLFFKPLTLLMGVPTVYARLLEYVSKINSIEDKEALQDAVTALSRFRLMVCGSAALPDSVLQQWETLTGYFLLERYGMTEIGMALSNPYNSNDRKAGSVGQPLPLVECRLVEETTEKVITTYNTPGELRIKGPNVFKKYLNRDDATKETFDSEGWFKTGDIAEVSPDNNYKILGRNSTDIIKSSGYKLSALEIERVLLAHPQILEAAVIGIKDDIYGEKVVAVIVLRNISIDNTILNKNNEIIDIINLQHNSKEFQYALQSYLSQQLAIYKHPREYIIVPHLPRNQLGKVNKKNLLTDIKKL